MVAASQRLRSLCTPARRSPAWRRASAVTLRRGFVGHHSHPARRATAQPCGWACPCRPCAGRARGGMRARPSAVAPGDRAGVTGPAGATAPPSRGIRHQCAGRLRFCPRARKRAPGPPSAVARRRRAAAGSGHTASPRGGPPPSRSRLFRARSAGLAGTVCWLAKWAQRTALPRNDGCNVGRPARRERQGWEVCSGADGPQAPTRPPASASPHRCMRCER